MQGCHSFDAMSRATDFVANEEPKFGSKDQTTGSATNLEGPDCKSSARATSLRNPVSMNEIRERAALTRQHITSNGIVGLAEGTSLQGNAVGGAIIERVHQVVGNETTGMDTSIVKMLIQIQDSVNALSSKFHRVCMCRGC